MAAYGLDTLDPAAVTPRRLAVLLDHLPPSARGPGDAWSVEAELLALLCDHVANLTWITTRAYGGKSNRPRPLPRPARRVPSHRAPASAGSGVNRSRHPTPEQGAVKTGSWAEAIGVLAGMAGVRVRGGTDG